MLSAVLDKSPLVPAGSTPLQPTSSNQFKIHHGKKGRTQAFLANLGVKMDQANGEIIQRPAPRYRPHNCLPWRHDSCVTRPNASPGQLNTSIASQTPVIQLQFGSPSESHIDNTGRRQFSSLAQFHTAITPEDIYSSSFTHSNRPSESYCSRAPTLTEVQSLEGRIQDFLLLYFLEGGGDVAPEDQRRDQTISILKEQFQTPIKVSVPNQDIAGCEEFLKVENVVERCLDFMCVEGIVLIPEFSDDGRELTIHLFL